MKFQASALLIFLLLAGGYTSGQIPQIQPFIEKAWQKNDALRSRVFDLKSAELAHSEAKAMYGPTIGFNTTYTLAAGGRNIAFPVGDLLNPVYNTLNSLTNSQQFQPLSNQEINFFPNNFYDAKFVINQPVYYPDLALNKQLKGMDRDIKSLEVIAFKRRLSKDVMVAAFQVESARSVSGIYQEASLLLNEARRATSSMVQNEIAPVIALKRIDAQLAEIKSRQVEADGMVKNAMLYFQHLTGDTLDKTSMADLPELPSLMAEGAMVREELLQLQTATQMSELATEKENNFFKPRLGASLSLGSQDFNFEWQPYALFGLNLDINLYDSKRHNLRKDAARAATEARKSQLADAQQLITLNSSLAENQLTTALEQLNTFPQRIAANQQLYKDTYARYKEGTANYLEWVDAQTQLTQIQIQYQLARYNAWIKWSEWVYARAILPIQ